MERATGYRKMAKKMLARPPSRLPAIQNCVVWRNCDKNAEDVYSIEGT